MLIMYGIYFWIAVGRLKGKKGLIARLLLSVRYILFLLSIILCTYVFVGHNLQNLVFDMFD